VHSKNLKHPRTISTIVESEVYEEFLDLLPRRVTFAEAIRQYMSDEVERKKAKARK